MWNVYKRNSDQVGRVTMLRRPLMQDDFKVAHNRSFLMSYQELTHIAMPDILNGWGIDPTLFDDTIKIYVKQLSRPIGKDILYNIRIASMLNVSNLGFINLAPNPP